MKFNKKLSFLCILTLIAMPMVIAQTTTVTTVKTTQTQPLATRVPDVSQLSTIYDEYPQAKGIARPAASVQETTKTTTVTTVKANEKKAATTKVQDNVQTTTVKTVKTTEKRPTTTRVPDNAQTITSTTFQEIQQNPETSKVLETAQIAQSEIGYYQTLKSCAISRYEDNNNIFETYGLEKNTCNFEFIKKEGATNKTTSVCKFSAPLTATQEFAENKIKSLQPLTGQSKMTSGENNTIYTGISKFLNRYCR